MFIPLVYSVPFRGQRVGILILDEVEEKNRHSYERRDYEAVRREATI